MTLATLRQVAPARSRDELLQLIAHKQVCRALDMQAYCASELDAGTVTTRSDDGVFTQIIYRDTDDVKRRYALRLAERNAIEAQQRSMRWWSLCALNSARRRAARAWLDRLVRECAAKELRDETNVRELHAAHQAFFASECARSRRRHARPLAICRASNAPNVLSVSTHRPRHAACQQMRANT